MEIVLMVLGGLGLFLFALNNLSDTLKDLLGNQAKKMVELLYKKFIDCDCDWHNHYYNPGFLFCSDHHDDYTRQDKGIDFSPISGNCDGSKHRHYVFQPDHRFEYWAIFAYPDYLRFGLERICKK